MRDLKDAIKLAKIMVKIGEELDKETIAVISNMEEPLGFAIGNSLEIKEAIDILKNRGPEDLREICLFLGSHMLKLGGIVDNIGKGRKILLTSLKNGTAFSKFIDMVKEHGGDIKMVENPQLLPEAKYRFQIKCHQEGYIHKINSKSIGLSAMLLGAGREEKGSIIDLSVGIVLKKKIGEKINAGEVLAEVFYNKKEKLEQAIKLLNSSFEINKEKPKSIPLILATVDKNGVKKFTN
jgi:pyrimidine-nucleoside phosphorylase